MATTKYPGLVREGKLWVVRFRVPPALRGAFGGRSYLSKSTKATDITTAWLAGKGVLEGWKDRVRDLRAGLVVSDWEPPEAPKARAVVPVASAKLSSPASLQSPLPTGQTPFLGYLTAWRTVSGVRPRQTAQYAMDIGGFGRGRFVQDVTPEAVQAWVEGLLSHPKAPLSPRTARRKLASLRAYWRYLQAHGVAPRRGDNSRPFDEIRLPRAVNGPDGTVRIPRVPRRPWTPQEVSRLWQSALNAEDEALADLIALGAYTGARIEELCKARVADLGEQDGVKVLRVSGKTRASHRAVPIHTKLLPVLKRMVEGAREDHEGWLVTDTSPNSYGERSMAIGQRFSVLKTSMGFGPELVFHSLSVHPGTA